MAAGLEILHCPDGEAVAVFGSDETGVGPAGVAVGADEVAFLLRKLKLALSIGERQAQRVASGLLLVQIAEGDSRVGDGLAGWIDDAPGKVEGGVASGWDSGL